ncbi:hypothetical protein HF313_21705 [Massilia atriviolacea]|uniref:Uncharacterized protein n=1 Tax=Massilia atriviolacea TaxID=2495579 RepID=A0A430HFA3_9BURK|nr:hypothetical protein [Massilia atriviolacea]RSZ56191.1 hypothetical protein EJB06_25140 [Massilia atriviolacea]
MSTPLAAMLSSFTQSTRLLRLSTPLGADNLLAECVRGEETISAGFRFTIGALATDAAIGLRSLLGKLAPAWRFDVAAADAAFQEAE